MNLFSKQDKLKFQNMYIVPFGNSFVIIASQKYNDIGYESKVEIHLTKDELKDIIAKLTWMIETEPKDE